VADAVKDQKPDSPGVIPIENVFIAKMMQAGPDRKTIHASKR
jgi:hypothetical protein